MERRNRLIFSPLSKEDVEKLNKVIPQDIKEFERTVVAPDKITDGLGISVRAFDRESSMAFVELNKLFATALRVERGLILLRDVLAFDVSTIRTINLVRAITVTDILNTLYTYIIKDKWKIPFSLPFTKMVNMIEEYLEENGMYR